MKNYTVNDYVRMSNAQLRNQLNSVVLVLMAHGVSEKVIEQFSLASAELVLRVNEGSLIPEQKKGGKHARQ